MMKRDYTVFFRQLVYHCPKIIPEIRAIRGDQNNLTEAI